MTGEFGPLGWPYAGGSSAAVSRTKGRQRGQRQAHGVGDCSVSRCVLLAQAADTMAAISVLPVRCGTSIQGLSVHRRQLAANRRHTGLLPITLIPGSQVHIILYVLSDPTLPPTHATVCAPCLCRAECSSGHRQWLSSAPLALAGCIADPRATCHPGGTINREERGAQARAAGTHRRSRRPRRRGHRRSQGSLR